MGDISTRKGVARGQGRETAFEKRDIWRGVSKNMMIIIQSMLIKYNIGHFYRYIYENLHLFDIIPVSRNRMRYKVPNV